MLRMSHSMRACAMWGAQSDTCEPPAKQGLCSNSATLTIVNISFSYKIFQFSVHQATAMKSSGFGINPKVVIIGYL